MQYRFNVPALSLAMSALFAGPAALAQSANQPGSLLGLVQVLTGPGLTANVANDRGGPALLRLGALPVGNVPSLVVSAVNVAPIDLIPLPSATQVPILPGVLSLSAGPGLTVNLLADSAGPTVVDAGLVPLGDGSSSLLGVRALQTGGLNNLSGVPGVLDLAASPALSAGALNGGANSSLVNLAALPVNGIPGALVTAIGFEPVNSPLGAENVPQVTAQLVPGVLEAQLVPGLKVNVLNDGGGPAIVDLGVIPLTQGGFGVALSALTTPAMAVPEPTTWAMFFIGLTLLSAACARQRRATRSR